MDSTNLSFDRKWPLAGKCTGRLLSLILAFVACALLTGPIQADPCGMVPPIQMTGPGAISRVGLQQTYVFYKDGVESFVIRPGFTGKVEEFGMLIPFPTPPALRKVGDDIFPHIAAAIDPPEVVLDMRPMLEFQNALGAKLDTKDENESLRLASQEVRVLNQEAVGMYEVAVLEAGSPAALRAWMTDHEYRFPEGMEEVCGDYIELQWCFVAVKTRVSGKSGVDPTPGMRSANAGLPDGTSFDGAVQGMGFRFETDELVVPMRLSAFNEGELRNIVYLLTDEPKKIRAIPEEYVVRQIQGVDLFKHVTEPLPLRIIGGTAKDISASQRQWLKTARDPAPKNALAAELFAGDLLAADSRDLSHSHEEREKMLLRIGESLGLRGPEVDAQHYAALESGREEVLDEALADVKTMTLTVVDGDFPREVLGGQNLTFGEYRMPARRNNSFAYDCTIHGPQQKQVLEGVLIQGALTANPPEATNIGLITRGMQFVLSLGITAVLMGALIFRSWRERNRK